MTGGPESLEEIIAICRRRCDRAAAKFRAAHEERLDAERALGAAELRLTEWHIAHPDPQGSIFEELYNV